VDKPIRFTPYALAKFVFLREHGFRLEERDVIQTVGDPDRVSRARMGRWVAQRKLSERHVLRVIYEEEPQMRVVVTFYPARRSRYEFTHDV
jgi:hypothetical protein